MEITIRQYKDSDRPALTKCLEDLQDHEAGTDPLHRVVRKEGFGKPYVDHLLQEISSEDGVIYLAEAEGAVVGVIASVIKHHEKHEVLGRDTNLPYGHTCELFVDNAFRSQNIGAMLMQKAEGYFLAKGCDMASVYVMASNTRAWEFYKKNGYSDRYINLYKKL